MATTCRICHPKQFDTKDPDPHLSIVYVDYEKYLNKTSDSEDESDGTSTSDSDHEENNPGNVEGLKNNGEEEGTEQHILDTSDETSDHMKGKRDIHRKNYKNNGRNRRGRRGNTKNPNRIVSTTRILMPTQEYYTISDIVVPHWKCGKKTKLVCLGPSKTRNREFDIVEAEMQKTIAHHDNCESAGGCFEQYNITKIQKIVQGCAWRKYQARKTDVALEAGSPNEKMLFHGTDAVWKIVSGGFDERFTSTNGQFGAGLYFAQHSSLANQFVFGYFGGNGCKTHHDKNCYICKRHLLLCRVTLGEPYQLKSIENMPHPPPGYHSVEALAGEGAFQNPEFVVYRGEQAYPEYLITYKIVKPKEDEQDKRDRKWNNGDNSKNARSEQAVSAGGNREHATSTSRMQHRGDTNHHGRDPSPRVPHRQDWDHGRNSAGGASQIPPNVGPPHLDDHRGDGRGNVGGYRDIGGASMYDGRS